MTEWAHSATHYSDQQGRALLSVFIRHDGTFQVVDERGGQRKVLADFDGEPKAKAATLEAFG